ncbi:MAG: carbohydrate-binding protein [Bacteroidetes bacterium CG18_big_fil_WC_8_21_14_2_50_41_14]|nr:MAG: carbohydrate-binding protein [Bacteroidetes bacterium CG18_big_fil_WC_8_21_14_2_50_41_14]PJB55166.1 MAG: carbohydrate-binding protein [Bacteroidetes bacterium CG_4_9_14_3_um_filter_41_19]
MKNYFLTLIIALLLVSCNENKYSKQKSIVTICNPLDLNYRFCLDEPSRREAADPTIVLFQDEFYLFASKSGGYWHSADLVDWKLIETNEIPTEEYAPTAIEINDTLYFLASSNEKSTIYKSTDPLSGKWTIAVDSLERPVWDPAFFMDDDNRLYLYWGCSDKNPIFGVEVDFEHHFAFIGEPKELMHANPAEYGWEVPGDYNRNTNTNPWIEGPWMNKHNGKYYLQYSGPGTEFKSYSDGIYTADNPLGPFTVADHNPFSYKPEGFAAAAGHGSTFADKYGSYWHMATSTISVKQIFERRLVLYPVFFDEQGIMYATTKFGDYPFIIPYKKIESCEELFPGWMLLSYGKKMEVSSSFDAFPASNMTDENIRTYWTARTGNAGEYATLDLGKNFDVYSIQVNFSEHNTHIFGRQKGVYHRYQVEYSPDGANWKLLIDQSKNLTDNVHNYTQLAEKVTCRYLRIKNIEVPDGNFALSGFRVFGKGQGETPDFPENFVATRNPSDRRTVKLSWDKTRGAVGYNISFGTQENKLYHDYIVYQDTLLDINILDTNQPYYFSIEAFNENGVGNFGASRRIE